ncbi:hypothetical protein K2173_023473 [Erythroxylum novogranatense]|uniref:SKP1-like protein n=1 Tax=Erythroxylum novogranatense TaxID=1862640 RepID=A0AAV8TW85_9ROSI|nr:hypothetical protein K2173_023473 [Erythroxylum novogranatense]
MIHFPLLKAKPEAMSSSSTAWKITLTSSDGVQFTVSEAVVRQSEKIMSLINSTIVLDTITGDVLKMVVDYCNKQMEFKEREKSDCCFDINAEMKPWEADFVKELDLSSIFDLILAADYLRLKGLYRLGCQAVVDRMRGRTLEEMRQMFMIKSDFTPEEEAMKHEEIQWARGEIPSWMEINEPIKDL